MRSERWLRTVLAGLLAWAGLVGNLHAGPTTVTVWTRASFNSAEGAATQDAVKRFNRRHNDIRVELYSSNYRNYAEWVQNVASTGSLPCMLEVDGPFLAEFAWPGYLRPIDRYVPAELRRDLLPSILAQGTYGGRLYSLGQFDSGLGLWAHRRHLEAVGVRWPTVEHPWSLSEFEQTLQKLARLPGLDYPLSLALYTSSSEFFAYAYLPLLAGFGGDLIDRRPNGRAQGTLDSPASVAALQRLQSWLHQGWTRAVQDRGDDFEQGRAALLWTGHWRYASLHHALGDDLVLLPLPDFGQGLKTGMGSWSWGITSVCPHPQAAWAFLSHLMSPDEVLRMAKASGAVPARRSVLERSPLYGGQGPLRIYAQQLSAGAGVPRPATPGYGTISAAFATAVHGVVNGGSPQAELSRAAQTIDADIAANRGYSR